MSEEKIKLPDFLIAELYKGTLVDLNTLSEEPVHNILQEDPFINDETAATPEKLKFLGDNEKRTVLVVHQPEAFFLPEDELAFLTNILKACQLNLADIAIINSATQTFSYEELKDQLNPSTVLLFDVEPSAIKLPFLIPPFQLQHFDGRTIMVAPPLALLNKPDQSGKLLKTKLWLSLKKVFNIQ